MSLEDYVSSMVEGQDKIYYITADSYAAAKNSPHLELFRKKGIEVLLLSDRIDEWMMSYLTEFDGKASSPSAKRMILSTNWHEKVKNSRMQIKRLSRSLSV